MVELIEIRKIELWPLVLASYKGDYELLEKYHIRPMKLEEAVATTMEMINGAEDIIELEYFKAVYNGNAIGYAIFSGTFIYSFGVALQYRVKQVLQEWWGAIKDRLGETFTCGLISNNTRAIKYMQDRGMQITWENPEKKEMNEILLTYFNSRLN